MIRSISQKELPALQTGRSSVIAVRISEVGQLAFSSKASEALQAHAGASGTGLIYVVMDDDKRELHFSLKPFGKPLLPVAQKVEDGITLRQAKKSNQLYFGAGPLCTAIGYDFKASGAQVFAGHSANGGIVITVPKGHLTPREAVKRPRKAKVNGVDLTPAAVAVEAAKVEFVD